MNQTNSASAQNNTPFFKPKEKKKIVVTFEDPAKDFQKKMLKTMGIILFVILAMGLVYIFVKNSAPAVIIQTETVE